MTNYDKTPTDELVRLVKDLNTEVSFTWSPPKEKWDELYAVRAELVKRGFEKDPDNDGSLVVEWEP